ncbi:hypothetical protein WJX81_005283 [Elliptochloris bilobata]|uniref:Carbonic anhydrase n=1 Tax=Elliptochloris bilobata TaxID=381761 RepID=A0AAW1RZR5_9CHLO
MDGRLMPATMFGFKLGQAEYIRNAGGRVTDDVIRSLFVAQELLHTKAILLVHHTDCIRDPNLMHWRSMEGLKESVKEDVAKLRASPLINKSIEIYGFVYDVKDASLTEVTRSVKSMA